MVVAGTPPVGTSTYNGGFKAGQSMTTDEALAKVNRERVYSYIRAWEEKEKSKSHSKYEMHNAKISAWESSKQAAAEAKMRQAQEALERRRAAILETMKNELAEVHRVAQERRAKAQAKRAEDFVKIEEEGVRYRSRGDVPSRKFLCFEI